MDFRTLKAYCDLPMTGVHKAILLFLAIHVNADGVCWYSYARMIEKTGFSYSSIRRALRWLEQEGYLSITERTGRSSIFTLKVDLEQESYPQVIHNPLHTEGPPLHTEGGTPSTQKGTPSTVKAHPLHTDDQNNKKISKENNNKGEKSQKRFVPPTLEEVQDYCKERENQVDAQRFVDFYAMKGWMVGKSRMKDWQAAVRTWEKSDKKTGTQEPAEQEWHATWSGIVAKGEEHGLFEKDYPTPPDFKAAVFKAEGKPLTENRQGKKGKVMEFVQNKQEHP